MYKLYKLDMDDYFNIDEYYRYDFVYFSNRRYNDKNYTLNNFIFLFRTNLGKNKSYIEGSVFVNLINRKNINPIQANTNENCYFHRINICSNKNEYKINENIEIEIDMSDMEVNVNALIYNQVLSKIRFINNVGNIKTSIRCEKCIYRLFRFYDDNDDILFDGIFSLQKEMYDTYNEYNLFKKMNEYILTLKVDKRYKVYEHLEPTKKMIDAKLKKLESSYKKSRSNYRKYMSMSLMPIEIMSNYKIKDKF